MFKCQRLIIRNFFYYKVIAFSILLFFLKFQIVIADIEPKILQYIAKRLLPNECKSIIINRKVDERSLYNLSSNEFDCFQNLVAWNSNFWINSRREENLFLVNRLRKIGRNDLANWLINQNSKSETVTDQETIEYESWNSNGNKYKKSSSSSSGPTISEIKNSVPIDQRSSINFVPDLRKLNGIRGLDLYKDRSGIVAQAEPGRPVSQEPAGVVTSVPVQPVSQLQGAESGHAETNTIKGDAKDAKNPEINSTQIVGVENPGDKKHEKPKFPQILSHLSDEKSSPCFRLPLGTALVVLGTIMSLTCCCALLLRNRIAACFERLRWRKKSKPGKRSSADEEMGFMGSGSFGKSGKRSGRKGGGPVDLVNVGIQNSNVGSNGSGDFDDRSTGCCNCCAIKKKKRNKRKRRK